MPSQDPNAANQNGSAAGHYPPSLLVTVQIGNIDFVGGPAVDVGGLFVDKVVVSQSEIHISGPKEHW